MSDKVNSDNEVIVLEVSGKNSDLENYQRILCEASLFGIDNVMFCLVWDDEVRGEKIFNKLIETCSILNIEICGILNINPLPRTFGYGAEMFHRPMISKLDDEMSIDLFHLISFDSYKSSRNEEIEENRIEKVFQKIKY